MPPANDNFKQPPVQSGAFPRPAAQRVVPMAHAAVESGVPQSIDSLESAPDVRQYDTDTLEDSEPKVTEVDGPEALHPDHLRLFRYNGLAMAVTSAVLVLIILIGASTLFMNSRHGNGGQTNSRANDYALGGNLQVGQIKDQLSALSDNQLEVNGQLKANDTLVVTPTARPADPETGQIYYDRATNQPYYYDGKQFVSFAAQTSVTSLGGASGLISVGGGLQVTNGQLALTPSATQALTGAVVNSLQGQTGNVTLTAGNGIGINGTIISNTGLTGISGTNGIAVSVAGGQVTIGLPQLLGTGDTPSFAGLSLANPLGVASGGTGASSYVNGGVVYYDGTALASTPAPGGNGLCLVSSPSGPRFDSCSGTSAVTFLNNLSGALTLQAGAGVTITDNGTNIITISAPSATGANVSLSNLSAVAINTDLLPGTTNADSLGTSTLRFKDLWLGGNATVGGTLAVTGDVTGGTYNTAAISGGSLTGSAVNNLNVSGTAISGTGALSISAGGSNQSLSLQGTGTGSVIIQTPLFHNVNGATYSFDAADTSGITATICTTAGNCAGQGGGVSTSGGTPGTIAVFTGTHAIGDSLLAQSGTTVTVGGTLAATNLQGDGSGVTNVNAATLQGNSASYFTNASNIATGTLSDNRLSTNVALLSGDNNFTGATLQHNGSDVCDASNNCSYAPAGGGNSYIWNGTTPQSADFNITGNGTMGTLSVTNNAGIGGTLTVTGAINNLTVSGTAISGTGAFSITAGGTNQNLSLQGSGTGSVVVQTPIFHNANGATYSFAADASGVNATICTTVGNCAGTGGGIIASGTPTAGAIPVFTGVNSIGNSQLSDSGTTLTYTGNMIIQGTNSLSLGTAGPSGKTGSLTLNNSTNANKLTLQAGATSGNLTFTFPTTYGANGNCLQTDGAGTLSFQPCTGTGPGGGVTSLDGLSGVLTLNNSSGTGSAITIDDASTSQKGIATFSSHNFKDDGAGTINTIQDIADTDSPTFGGLALNGNLNTTGTGTFGGQLNANGGISTGTGTINGQTINSTSSFTGTVAIQGANALTLGTTGSSTGAIVFKGSTAASGIITLQGPANPSTSNYTLSIPQLTQDDTICTVSTGCGSGGITGGGTGGTIPVYSGAGASTAIGDSILSQSGTTVTAAGTVAATALQGDGSGVTNVDAVTLQGNNSAYFTNASNISSGTLNDARLSANVALLNGTNTFSGVNTFSATGTALTVSHDASIGGTATIGTLSVTNNATVGGTLGVTGNTTLTGTLTVGTLGTNASTPLCADGSGLISTCSGGGGNSFILNGTAAQNANFNITGNGTVGGFTDTGTALFKNTSTSAFQIQNAGGTSNLFYADTQNSLIGIGVQPTVGEGTLQVANTLAVQAGTTIQLTIGSNCNVAASGICFANGVNLYDYNNGAALKTDGQFAAQDLFATGSLTFGAFSLTNFTTPSGATVPTKINIPLFQLGAYEQLIALGLESNSAVTSRAITVFDARPTPNPVLYPGGNQPAIGVISPDESNIFGLSWQGASTTGYLYVGGGGGITLRSGGNQLASWNSGGAATFKTASPVTNAFQLLDDNNISYLQADSANHRLAVGIATAPAYTLDVGGDVNISTGSVYRVNGTAGATQTCTGGQVLQAASVVGGIITGTPACGASAGSGINNSTSLQTAANFNVQSAATTSVTGQIRAIASQTADLLDFENSSGTVLSGFTASGALQGGNGSGTNGAGSNLVLAGGQGTGTGNGGDINFQIAKPGTTSGSTANSESTVFSLSGNNGAALLQNATDSTTAFQIQNAAGSSMLNFDTTSGTLSVLGTSLNYIGGTDANGTSNGGTGSIAANGVAVSGQYEYTVSAGSNASCSATAGGATGCELKAFNITNPSAPVYLGGADSTGSTNSGTGGSSFTSIAISGHYAYVTQTGSNTGCGGTAGGAIGCEFKVFDISNPAAPTYVAGIDANGTLNSGGGSINFNSVAISGNDAYIASAANNSAACSQTTPSIGCELKVFDISTPTAPSYIGGADASGSTNSGSASTQSFDSVAVSGNYAYVAATGNATVCSSSAGSALGCELKDFDISTPSAPTYLGGADATGSANVGGASNTFNSVAASGGYVYVATASNNTYACGAAGNRGFGCELQAYDVSNPANPMYAGGADASGLTNSGTAAAAVSFNDVTAAGGYVYVAASNNSTACSGAAGNAIGCELQQYNVTNPAAPTYAAGVDASGSTNSGTGTVQFNMVTVSGQNIYVASNASGTTCSATAGTAIGCEVKIFGNSGIQTTGLLSNSLETTALQVDGSGQIFGSLTVGQSLRVNGDALFQDSTSSTSAFQVQDVYGQTVFDVDTVNNRVCINATSCTNTLGVSGTIGASGSITANTTPDISETIPASADVTPGDVVSAGPDGNVDAVRSSVPYDPTTIGVISDGTSSFRINSNGGSADAPDTGKYLVLAGRVPVHVTDENGPIEPGDYLTTSSTPGYAMKATHAGPTIGKALAAFDGTSGTVMTQTNLSYYAGPSGADSVQNGGNATLSELTVGGMTNLAGLNVSGAAALNSLTVTGSATIGSLTVTGSASFAGNITVGGHIITSGGAPTVQAQAAAGAGAACTVTGNDTGGSITITTGSSGLTEGQECILTFNNDFGAAPNPVIAPRNKVSAQAQAFVDADARAMIIEFSNMPAANTTYTFNYFNTQ